MRNSSWDTIEPTQISAGTRPYLWAKSTESFGSVHPLPSLPDDFCIVATDGRADAVVEEEERWEREHERHSRRHVVIGGRRRTAQRSYVGEDAWQLARLRGADRDEDEARG